jgi:hypothetical protein
MARRCGAGVFAGTRYLGAPVGSHRMRSRPSCASAALLSELGVAPGLCPLAFAGPKIRGQPLVPRRPRLGVRSGIAPARLTILPLSCVLVARPAVRSALLLLQLAGALPMVSAARRGNTALWTIVPAGAASAGAAIHPAGVVVLSRPASRASAEPVLPVERT